MIFVFYFSCCSIHQKINTNHTSHHQGGVPAASSSLPGAAGRGQPMGNMGAMGGAAGMASPRNVAGAVPPGHHTLQVCLCVGICVYACSLFWEKLEKRAWVRACSFFFV